MCISKILTDLCAIKQKNYIYIKTLNLHYILLLFCYTFCIHYIDRTYEQIAS